MILKILMLGDVVRGNGIRYLASGGRLRSFVRENGVSLTVANGENSADGNGMTPSSFWELIDAGCDVVTGGNHTFRHRDVYSLLDDDPRALRPANVYGGAPGTGYLVADAGGASVLVVNLIGQVFMDPSNSPFEALEKILRREEGNYDAAVVDFHAEATSEKLALARKFDGRVAAVAGTHTHVMTADCAVLPGGTGYITDLGMTGSRNGVLGVKTECVIRKFTEGIPVKFEGSDGGERASGAIFGIDTGTGLCVSAQPVIF